MGILEPSLGPFGTSAQGTEGWAFASLQGARAWLPKRVICSGLDFWAISWAAARMVALLIVAMLICAGPFAAVLSSCSQRQSCQGQGYFGGFRGQSEFDLRPRHPYRRGRVAGFRPRRCTKVYGEQQGRIAFSVRSCAAVRVSVALCSCKSLFRST